MTGIMYNYSKDFYSPIYEYKLPTIKVKMLNELAKMPTKANSYDAGFDLYSTEDVVIPPLERRVVKTGISMEILEGYAGFIWPRSGLSVKSGIDVLAGVIDSGYRGEIMVCLYNTSKYALSLFPDITESESVHISVGDKIAQIVIQPISTYDLELAEELKDSERGENGFGSSGK